MDRGTWEKILTYFQAAARGYLVRTEFRRAREDFEEIVREIDGGLTHLGWRETVIPLPHFTDTDGALLRASSSAKELDDHCGVLQKTEAERDDAQSKAHASIFEDGIHNGKAGGDREGQTDKTLGHKDGGLTESTGDSTSAWSSLELDMNYIHKGPQQYCLAQEVPGTSEALRLHRNTLTMELVWLQQAIDSRKKYLSLKDRLSVS